MKTVYIESNGCAVLRHETYKIAKAFEENGYEQSDCAKDADIVVFTGCAVIDSCEQFALESINRITNEMNPHAKLVISGCIPAISTDSLCKLGDNVIILKYDELSQLNDIMGFFISIDDVNYNCNPSRHHSFGDPEIIATIEEEQDALLAEKIDEICNCHDVSNQFVYSTRGRHLWREDDLFEIRVSYGCAGKCSYCATKLAIGDFRSIKEDRILEQVVLAKELHYSRIMLMGDEIGFWNEGDKNIVDLISDILNIAPDIRIGIRYISPDIIVKYYSQFKRFFSSGSIYYFCAAFQSGSPKILKLMNRNTNIEPFINCMEDINRNHYPVIRHSQIIVGFPTESCEDIFKTLECLYRSQFDHVTITKYCPRKGTEAFRYPPLDQQIVDEHFDLLNQWLIANRNSKLYQSIKKEVMNFYDKN